MSGEKFEHKDELDCEVTVFEGAHTTCDKIKDAAAEAGASKKSRSRRRKNLSADQNRFSDQPPGRGI